MFIAGCGGGGSTTPSSLVHDTTTTIKGSSCNNNVDALGSTNFITVHEINERVYGCLIVDRSDGFPVLDGLKSARFEVRPWDCSANIGYNDCVNDRARHEIQDASIWSGTTNGQTITYTTNLYIPRQEAFKPRGSSILFLGQIVTNNGPSGFGTVAFLEVNDNNDLVVRSNVLPQSSNVEKFPLTTNIFDRWIRIQYEIRSSRTSGYIKIYVDNELKFERSQATLLDDSGATGIKLGIYNAFKSGAMESFQTQIIYYDGLNKTIQ